jgi:cell division protease FtsH
MTRLPFKRPRLGKRALIVLFLPLAVLAVLTLRARPSGERAVQPVALNELAQRVRAGDITDITESTGFGTAVTGAGQTLSFQTGRGASLPKVLTNFGVRPDELAAVHYVVAEPPSDWLGLVLGLAPLALMGGLLFFLLRRPRDGNNPLVSFGKSRARVLDSTQTLTSFQDVAGVEEPRQELQEVVEFLREPEKFAALGARIPRGVLLIGPPGTGKTLLARAVAGEADVPFFSISGSEFVEMFVGVGASRVRELFERARRAAPCIVFIDEIDAVGRQRGAGLGNANDEREQTLNQILVEMDGFDDHAGVIVVAATNRPDVLDPALLRPGRFDRVVIVPTPDLAGRRAILAVHARGKPFEAGVALETLASQTPGFSGADLANVLNEGAILAARRDKQTIGMPELDEAVERVVAGPERRSHLLSERDKQLSAYHEGGRALVASSLPHHDPVHKISIIPRGLAIGSTRFMPAEDRAYMTRSQFADALAASLGGHAAEMLVFGEVSAGAGDDIDRATNLARRMVKECGMSERLGPVAFGKKQRLSFLGRDLGEQRNYSDKVGELIDQEIRRLIDEGYTRALSILRERRVALDRIALELTRAETIDAPGLEQIVSS